MSLTRLTGTAIAVSLPETETLMGVLLRGPSGCGKSDLALRLIDSCPLQRSTLIGDDQILLSPDYLLSPHEAIKGKLEIRGLGIVTLPYVTHIPLIAVIDLVTQRPPRLPEHSMAHIQGRDFAHLTILPFEASASAKIRQFLSVIQSQ